MKLIWFFGTLVLNVSIVIPMVWWMSEVGYYAFLFPAVFAIISLIINITASDARHKKIALLALLGALVSVPTVFIVSFIMLLADGGMC